MSRPIKGGSTDQSTVIRFLDNTTGLPVAALDSTTPGLSIYYRREGAATVSLILSDLGAANSAHSDGGIYLLGHGYVRVDLPDAAVAGSNTGVFVSGTATGMTGVGEYHPLVAYDPQDTVRLGLTALPNAAADAAGGLVVSDAGGLDIDALNTNVSAILADTGTDGVAIADGSITAAKIASSAITDAKIASGAITSAKLATGAVTSTTLAAGTITTASIADGAITAAKIASSAIALIWNYLTSALTTSGSIGKYILDRLSFITSSSTLTSVGIVSNGTVIEGFQGKAILGITLYVPVATIDLRGYNAVFGATKLVSTTGDSDFEVDFTIEDAGVEDEQRITGNISKTITGSLSVDDDPVIPFGFPTGRAYKWSISVNNSNSGTAQAGGASTITLATSAASHTDDFYNGQSITITGGTGSGQTRTISDYTASTRVATVSAAWDVQPDNTSVYTVAAGELACVESARGELSIRSSETGCTTAS